MDSGPLEVELVFLHKPFLSFLNPYYQFMGLKCSHVIGVSSQMQSHYRCQFMDCTQIFLQKAAACTHVHCDHLNVAFACLYCSGREDLKMHWFSASAWEKHICKHSQDGLPLFPDDPAFTQLSLRLCPPPLALLPNLSP